MLAMKLPTQREKDRAVVRRLRARLKHRRMTVSQLAEAERLPLRTVQRLAARFMLNVAKSKYRQQRELDDYWQQIEAFHAWCQENGVNFRLAVARALRRVMMRTWDAG